MTKHRLVAGRDQGEEEMGNDCLSREVSFWGVENVLEVDISDGVQHCDHTKGHWIEHVKMANLMLCKFT